MLNARAIQEQNVNINNLKQVRAQLKTEKDPVKKKELTELKQFYSYRTPYGLNAELNKQDAIDKYNKDRLKITLTPLGREAKL